MIKLKNKYKPLIYNNTRYTVISGGRGSGKSYSVAAYLLMLSFETDRVILYVRYTMKDVKVSIYPEFLSKIEELGIDNLFEITKNEIINKNTNTKIIFKGIKTGSSIQTANLKSIANVDTLVVDEAEEIPSEEIFDKMDFSIRSIKKFNKIIILFNPTTKESWLYKRFFEEQGLKEVYNGVKNDITYIHTTYIDVMDKLSESFIKKFEEIKKTNIKKYNHIILGNFLDKAEGVIFTNWEIGDFNNELEYGFGADFGYSVDPSTLIKIAIDNKNKIIYLDEVLYESGLTTTDLINKYSYCGNKLIVADNSEPRLIEEIKKSGVNIIPCVKGAGSVLEGIKFLQDYKLIVSDTSINIIKELNNYIWSDRKSGTPIDMYNHCLDGVRYYISHILKRPNPPKNLGIYIKR